jgi:integrase
MTERSLKIKPQKEIVKPNPNRLKEELAQSQDRDPYYTHGKIERCEQRIEESSEIRPRNKQLFLTFVKWLRSDATAVKSESRVLKYYRHFWLILRLCEKDMEEMTRQDVEELLDKIRGEKIYGGKSYSPATYADFLRLIKIFWKWMKTGGESLPLEVKWIRVIDPPSKIKAENIPTEQEIHAMREAMRNPRDKALIMVMKESGWRVGEHLQTQIKNVSHTNDGIELSVVSPKTGELLWTLLIEAVPWLQLWLENYPDKNNTEAYLASRVI